MSHQLLVFPDDTAAPLVTAIDGARRTLNIRMFLFTDTALLEAVITAHRRGVKVQVMLNPARRSGESENEASRKQLTDAGVNVQDSNPAFDLTHQKSMVVDDETGFVESLNWEPKDLTLTRDYAVVTTRSNEINEMVDCFNADWARKEFKPPADSTLLWCPNNGRRRMAEFIDSATRSLWLQNERYQDTVILERLVRAARRGVKVHILAKPPHSLKPDKLIEGVGGLRILQDVGVEVHTLRHLKLHAKILLADGERAIVGSINIAPGSFDSRRELAIETDDKETVKRLKKTVKHDWEKSRLLDLSDAALLADLKKRAALSPDKLVLYEDSETWGYHRQRHDNGNGHGHKGHDKKQGKSAHDPRPEKSRKKLPGKHE